MSILDDLKKQLPTLQKNIKRVILPDGLLSISDGVFLCALQQLKVDVPSQIELMEEPIENRQEWVRHYEGATNENK